LSDDDRLLPAYIERLIRPMIENNGLVAAFCDHWIISTHGDRLARETDENSCAYGRTGLVGGIVEDPLAAALQQKISVVFALFRTALMAGETFDLGCGGAADIDFALRAARKGPFFYVPERLAEYRAHPGTVTSMRTAFMLDGAIHAYNKHRFADAGLETIRLARLRRAYAVKALFNCSKNRAEWRDSIRGYRRSGGSFVDSRILLSIAGAALPHRASERLRAIAKAARRISAQPQKSPDTPNPPEILGRRSE
jgi:hypothetical protein